MDNKKNVSEHIKKTSKYFLKRIKDFDKNILKESGKPELRYPGKNVSTTMIVSYYYHLSIAMRIDFNEDTIHFDIEVFNETSIRKNINYKNSEIFLNWFLDILKETIFVIRRLKEFQDTDNLPRKYIIEEFLQHV